MQAWLDMLVSLPMWVPRVLALLIFAAVIGLVWLLPERISGVAGGGPLLRDLRFWASLLLAVQLVLYLIF